MFDPARRSLLLSLLAVAPLAAQSRAAVAPAAPPTAVIAAPSLAPQPLTARAGIAPAAELAPVPAPAPLPGDPKAWLSKKSSKGLMVFGGAAFATGLVVGDDAGRVISLGGAAVFLVGLWQYLK